MEIAVNKHYINATGTIIFIVEEYTGIQYQFRDTEDYGYLRDRRFLDCDRLDTHDLICECVPEILEYYMDNLITQKEFIQQHIDYYTKNKGKI